MKSLKIPISIAWLERLSLIYLTLPFLIFCIGFLKIGISVIICGIFILIIVRGISHATRSDRSFCIPLSQLTVLFLIIALWVALSGIGGFSFQNYDFHIRNAIFRDLINYDWPVTYVSQSSPLTTYRLVYYIGFWLPAALAGKIAGWQFANTALFIWSILGVTLTVMLVSSKIKLSPPKLVLSFVFFSGMDVLGKLLSSYSLNGSFSLNWPPITHLEWWSMYFQYSSMTTQLFFVFNQAIPAWICMALLFISRDRRNILLIWSLCAFLAPIPSLGMFPFVLAKIPKSLFDPDNLIWEKKSRDFQSLKHLCWKDIRAVLTFENILAGGIVLGISLAYFSSNVQFANRSTPTLNPAWVVLLIAFLLLEGGLIWWTLRKNNQHILSWYVAGLLLFVIPIIKIGDGFDFCMRASIPTLFMLFVWSATAFTRIDKKNNQALLLFLLIGAVTPIFEINRSVYRTVQYYLNPPAEQLKVMGEKMRIYPFYSFEYDHPYTLTADSYKSLANFNLAEITNFVAKPNDGFYTNYLSK